MCAISRTRLTAAYRLPLLHTGLAHGTRSHVVPAAVAMTMGPSMKSTLSMVMAMRRP